MFFTSIIIAFSIMNYKDIETKKTIKNIESINIVESTKIFLKKDIPKNILEATNQNENNIKYNDKDKDKKPKIDFSKSKLMRKRKKLKLEKARLKAL